ncbi:hypothetical protein C2R22_20705 [Salinigranum rubrum]|uniref:DUF5305 domain-containing protein n=1 Tax=Salinigranum rubrum TaxID=755307 RepID=A0A2I8VPC7_9EURY|nr:DUF5305 domain-containing protein [Salinigranum rubrum]AUV83768.1 hypothetical protein C2R22_20705 [Salinigranum rubrum]
MSRRTLRLRRLLNEQFDLLLVVLAVLALVGGAVTYTTHVSPETTTEERVVETWQTSGSFDHSATVTEENPLFPVGSRLQNRSVYFSSISPVLNGSYVFSYRASGGGELTTSVDVVLVTRNVISEGEEQQTVLWETSRPLRETGTATIAPGTTARVRFGFNVSEVAGERDRIEEELGGTTGTTETFVRATVDVEGTVNGRAVDTQQVHTLPVTLEGGTYRVGPAEAGTNRFETTRQVTTTRTYGPLRSVGAPVLLFVSLVGLAGLVVARSQHRFELTDAEREWLTYREHRAEFDEWITTFTLPAEVFDRSRAEASSLADLVDLAIDTNNAVIESPDGTEYSVLDGGFRYVYTAPQPATAEAEPSTFDFGSGESDGPARPADAKSEGNDDAMDGNGTMGGDGAMDDDGATGQGDGTSKSNE